MWQFVNSLVSMPALPGTVLLLVCAGYWLLLIAGAVDLDLADIEVDADADVHPGGSSWGMAALKFANLGDVPLMIWLSVFSVAYVAAAVVIETRAGVSGEGWEPAAAAVALAGAIALVATKALTQPLRGKFDTVEPNRAETLVGRTCVVTTSEVSDRFGQARLEAEGAPLLLHVRGEAGTLGKNDVALITAYDADRGVFLVSPVSANPSDPVLREAV